MVVHGHGGPRRIVAEGAQHHRRAARGAVQLGPPAELADRLRAQLRDLLLVGLVRGIGGDAGDLDEILQQALESVPLLPRVRLELRFFAVPSATLPCVPAACAARPPQCTVVSLRGGTHTSSRWVFATPLKPPSHVAAAARRRRALRSEEPMRWVIVTVALSAVPRSGRSRTGHPRDGPLAAVPRPGLRGGGRRVSSPRHLRRRGRRHRCGRRASPGWPTRAPSSGASSSS